MDSEIRSTSEYKKIPLEEIFNLLKASADGLAGSEAGRRLEIFGYNEITEEKKSLLLEFLRRYWGPMPWLLELAMGLSFILGHYLEGALILALLTVNAVIGHFHSLSSQKAVDMLKKKLAIRAKVLRDGKWTIIGAREIVPGDMISVNLGDIVPADAVVASGELSVDESALTGESLPVEAGRSDIVYSGSVIRRGEAGAIVVNTGPNTYFGRTAELVKIAKPKSHQEEVMLAIVRYMLYIGIIASLLVSAYAIANKISVLSILTFAVIFLMGAVPVALP
ncbi:MAG: HAD-IC family P-type ATPase, partial [Nitrospiraceae bacterium]|nr:HAD-IC family P-type ATPase [Nitrospiraceae bacterium]